MGRSPSPYERIFARDFYFWGVECVGKCECDLRSLADMAYERGAEASDAGASGVANAGVYDSGGALIEQAAAELLGSSIAVGIQIFFVGAGAALMFIS
jgi:hypothetical protein